MSFIDSGASLRDIELDASHPISHLQHRHLGLLKVLYHFKSRRRFGPNPGLPIPVLKRQVLPNLLKIQIPVGKKIIDPDIDVAAPEAEAGGVRPKHLQIEAAVIVAIVVVAVAEGRERV